MTRNMSAFLFCCLVTGITLTGTGAVQAKAAETDQTDRQISNPTGKSETSIVGELVFAQCEEYINIRSGASTEDKVTGKIYNNGSATVLAQEDDWYKIQSGNAVGYVKAEYFATGERAEEIARAVAYHVAYIHPAELNIRSGPDEDTKTIGVARHSEELEVVAYHGDWMKVALGDDVYGYVNAYYVDYKTYYPTAETLEEEQARLSAESSGRNNVAVNSGSEAGASAESETGYSGSEPLYTETSLQYTESEYTGTESLYSETEPQYTETEPQYSETEYTQTEPQYSETEYTETEPQYSETEYSQTEPQYSETEYTETEPQYSETEYTETEPQYSETEYTETEPQYSETEYMETEPQYSETEYTETEPQYSETEYTETEPQYSETEYMETEPQYSETEYTETEPQYSETEYTETESPQTEPSSSSGVGQQIADYAVQFVGNPYQWGGTSLTNGADCSGFVQSVFANFGIGLARVAADQSYGGTSVSTDSLQPGDLVFYGSGGIDHVAIYIGGGQIVHAANSNSGIIISSCYYDTPVCARRYW